MKNICLILFALCLATSGLFARCGGGGYEVFPKTGSIAPNSMILLEAWGNMVPAVNEKIYLVSGNEKIELTAVQAHSGRMMAQVLLKPSKKLKKGKVYKLFLENPPTIFLPRGETGAFIGKYDYEKGKDVDFSWEVSAEKDTEAPVFSEKPVFSENSFVMYGCGPSAYSSFDINGTDNQSLFYVVTLYDKKGKEMEGSAILQANEEGVLSVGHGMCGGEFFLEYGQKYKMEVYAMDLGGNKSADTWEVIFEAPKRENSRF